jgi:hypothetical protein
MQSMLAAWRSWNDYISAGDVGTGDIGAPDSCFKKE